MPDHPAPQLSSFHDRVLRDALTDALAEGPVQFDSSVTYVDAHGQPRSARDEFIANATRTIRDALLEAGL